MERAPYELGDQIVIEPVPEENVSKINLEDTTAICTRILRTALTSSTLFLEYAEPDPEDETKLPWQTALDPNHSKYPMVGPPYTDCGYVLFNVYDVP